MSHVGYVLDRSRAEQSNDKVDRLVIFAGLNFKGVLNLMESQNLASLIMRGFSSHGKMKWVG